MFPRKPSLPQLARLRLVALARHRMRRVRSRPDELLRRWMHRAGADGQTWRGQSLVEFALVLPMLIVLLLGIADFGRVFTAGITLEAAARNAAEVVALERLRNPPSTPGDIGYYEHLHDLAAATVCHETRQLPNVSYEPGDPTDTPPVLESCPRLPVVAVCVHDGADPLCSAVLAVSGHTGTVPPQCVQILDSDATDPHPYSNASGGEVASHSVEVRVCHEFTTLFNLNMALPMNAGLSLGSVWLERTREFVIDCPPGGVAAC